MSSHADVLHENVRSLDRNWFESVATIYVSILIFEESGELCRCTGLTGSSTDLVLG